MNDSPPRPFRFRTDRELKHPQVLSLLEEHLAGMRAASPPECVFALDPAGSPTATKPSWSPWAPSRN